MQSLYSWTLDIYLAIVAILWGHANAIGHTSTKLYISGLEKLYKESVCKSDVELSFEGKVEKDYVRFERYLGGDWRE